MCDFGREGLKKSGEFDYPETNIRISGFILRVDRNTRQCVKTHRAVVQDYTM